jgi:flagellar L-ring protein precursor FlgH
MFALSIRSPALSPRGLARLGLIGIALLAGCATSPKEDHSYAPARPVALPPVLARTGSIYHAGYEMRLFEDVVARHVGDNLTIKLEEKTAAKKQADTSLTKDNTGAVSLDIAGANLNPWSGSLDSSAKRKFDGKGESQQSNSLTGNITVVVSEVLANGNLVVRGEKWLTLNQGDEFIRISGIVRPADIAPDNTVPSYLVADARISYGGEGPVADANTLGWIARFFISALFPF